MYLHIYRVMLLIYVITDSILKMIKISTYITHNDNYRDSIIIFDNIIII